jgi:hypothetical protein
VTLYMVIDGAAVSSRPVAADELQIWLAAEHRGWPLARGPTTAPACPSRAVRMADQDLDHVA